MKFLNVVDCCKESQDSSNIISFPFVFFLFLFFGFSFCTFAFEEYLSLSAKDILISGKQVNITIEAIPQGNIHISRNNLFISSDKLKINSITFNPNESTFYEKFIITIKGTLLQSNISILTLKVKYQGCKENICFAPQTSILKIKIKQINKNPLTFQDKNNFFSFDNKSKLITIFMAFLLGVLTSFTPCVYPMIPVTMAIITSSVKRHSLRNNFILTLIYVGGIVITYSVIGALTAIIGTQIRGIVQSIYVSIFVGIIFLVMGMSLLGVFDINFSFINISRIKFKGGIVSIFFLGIVSGLVASPCVAAPMIGLLSYIASHANILEGVILLFSFGWGMCLLLIIAGTSTGFLGKLPRSGRWMMWVKKFMGVVFILVALYFVYPHFHHLYGDYKECNKEDIWKYIEVKDFSKIMTTSPPFIIDFSAEWCVYCKELDRHIFKDKKVRRLLQHFSLYRIDLTQNYGEANEIFKRYHIYGLPAMIIVGNTKKRVLQGYIKKEDFIEILEDFVKE